MNEIARHHNTFVVTAATTNGDKIPMKMYAGAAVVIGHTAGATEIAWHGCAGQNDTPLAIYSGGSPLTTAVEVGVHPLPDEAFAVNYVVPVLSNGTTISMTVMAKG